MTKKSSRAARLVRHARVREKLNGTAQRPRLCVFRSSKHIYAQIIDDDLGNTCVAASTLDAEVKGSIDGKKKSEQAEIVGGALAKKAIEKGIKQVVFDRGGFKYQGRVEALAQAARKGGLEF